jgi:hypothetical protein
VSPRCASALEFTKEYLMDIVAIKGAYDAIAFAKTAFNVFVDTKADAKAKEQVTQVQERLGSVQDVLFSLREELGRLQGENSSLKEKLRAFEIWAGKSTAYALKETSGGAVVYHSDGPPPHFACPRCYESQEVQILQDGRMVIGDYLCPKCQTRYAVKPREPITESGHWLEGLVSSGNSFT